MMWADGVSVDFNTPFEGSDENTHACSVTVQMTVLKWAYTLKSRELFERMWHVKCGIMLL